MAADNSSDWLQEIERCELFRTALRALLVAGVLTTLYFIAPIPHRHHATPVVHVVTSLVLVTVVLAFEIRQIAKSEQPMLRAGVAMATVLPLFLLLFAWIYLVMAQTNVTSFGQHLSRMSALYFAVTVFSTVGFGDITAKTDAAKLVVTLQMLADLTVIAVVVRLIFGAASRGQRKRSEQAED